MTELEFQKLASQGYTRIPVLGEARADLYTPLALYAQLANGPYSYLLESVVGGERFGRYSFIGLACSERIERICFSDSGRITNLVTTVRKTIARPQLA